MQINKKDKSFILFVATALVLFWVLFSFFSYIFYNATYGKSAAAYLINNKSVVWINSDPLKIEDLKNKIIIVNFSNYYSSNSVYASSELQNIIDKFVNKITVIGVHSTNFPAEKDINSLQEAAERYGLNYPIINDQNLEITKKFKVTKIPTILLISPYGKVFGSYNETEFQQIEKDIKKLLNKHFIINKKNDLRNNDKSKEVSHILKFPTKIAFAEKFEFNNYKGSAIFVTSSAGNSIIVSSLSGKLITKIGSGKKGFIDGDFGTAAFNFPRGLLFADNKLYVADSSNNALRIVDFVDQEVKTLIGSGKIGGKIMAEQKATNSDLAMPWDLEFFPDEENIAISNAATNQILQYNIKKNTIKAIANDLNQPAGLKAFNNKLYFVDSNSNSIKSLDKSGNLATLTNKTDLQYPTDLTIDNSGIYIADSFSQTIKRYDFSSKKISTIIGSGDRGDSVASAKNTEFNEPEGLVSISNKFYIVDTNNHRIVTVDRKNNKVDILNILPPLELSKDQILKYLPNLHKLANAEIAEGKIINLKIRLPEGFKINEEAPSFINLLELVSDKEANLISAFDWNMIANKELKLPSLKGDYILQGTIYYCEDKANALCYIDSVEQKIETAKFSRNTFVIINLDR